MVQSSNTFAPFPVRGLPQAEGDISFSRSKRRWIALSVAYRLMHLARRLFGAPAVLRFMLNANWISWRLSYEISMEHFGPAFRNTTYGVSDELFEKWIPRGGSVLDIGCGAGRLCHMAGPYASRVVGIDYDPVVIAQARSRSTQSHIEFRIGDVRTALPGEQFDLALLVAVLEHIQNVDQLLQDVRRVAPRMIVEVPDFEADCLNLVRRDLGCRWYTDADHVREYIKPVLNDHLVRNGWIPREWQRRGGMILVVADRDASVGGVLDQA